MEQDKDNSSKEDTAEEVCWTGHSEPTVGPTGIQQDGTQGSTDLVELRINRMDPGSGATHQSNTRNGSCFTEV